MCKKATRAELIAGMERGKKVKRKAKEKGVPLWWLSQAYGINDGNLSRLLRSLSDEDYEKLSKIIDELAVEN